MSDENHEPEEQWASARTTDGISIPALRTRQFSYWQIKTMNDGYVSAFETDVTGEVLALVEAVEAAQECLSHPIGSPEWERASKRLKAAHARFEFGEQP